MNRFVKQIHGVTLIELMIVIVIVGIIAGFAGPQYSDLMKRQSVLSESRRITSLLKLARSEARARGANIVMSRSGADWSGTITVTEFNNDPAIGDEEIRRDQSSGRVLSADSSLAGTDITFGPKGWSAASFTIAICTSSSVKKNGRFINVNRVGKIKEGPIGDESCTQ